MTLPDIGRGRLTVQICNERLLPRFGVDRLLMLAGRFFQRQDIDVSYLCLRHDPKLLHAGQDRVTVLPVPPGLDIRTTERHITNLVMAGWMDAKPDILLIGGWPFFEIAGRAAALGVQSIFIDAGAVPHDGLDGDQLAGQLELRRQRLAYLPYIGQVLPISDFIRDTQTLPDRGHGTGVHTVLLGSDHLNGKANQVPSDGGIPIDVRALREAGSSILLNLGRFERHGYKNSPAFIDLIARLRDEGLDVAGLILAEPDELDIPPHLRSHILCLGRTTDAEMLDIMHEADLGISMSLWEGFNLPLVEMQTIGKPVLAFNLGAHPEVVAHPWQLCRDQDDMAARVKRVLAGDPAIAQSVLPALAAFKGRLPWANTLNAWSDALHSRPAPPPPGRRLLFIDVTNSAQDIGNSGVVRVTRQLTRCLKADDRFDVVFARWDGDLREYVAITAATRLSSFGGPTDMLGTLAAGIAGPLALDTLFRARDPQSAAPPIALIPEVVLDNSMPNRRSWLRYRGFLISSVLYDLIPIYHPEHCHPDIVQAFPAYLQALRSFDQCIAISASTMADFIRNAGENHASPPASRKVVWLPAQLANAPRVTEPGQPDSAEIRILCVSTIEPRKNHRGLLQAFRQLKARRPDLPLRLVLVGNSYIGAQDLLAAIQDAQDQGVPVDRLGIISDDELTIQYRRARFTIYPSLVEGFGIPIMESLWLGRPCVCANTGVMAELAAGGGCLTVDMHDPAALSNAMEQLATDDGVHRTLIDAATTRPLTSWDDYAHLVGDALDSLANLRPATSPSAISIDDPMSYIDHLIDGPAPAMHGVA